MTNLRAVLFSTTTVVGAMVSAPALAQVTPDDVWSAWQSMALNAGYAVAVGSTESTPSLITVSDVSFSLSEDMTTLETKLDEMRFADNGDGTVSITFSPEYQAIVAQDIDGEGPIVLPIDVDASSLVMTVSGTPGAMRHDFAAPAVSVTVDTVIDGEEEVDMDVNASMLDLQGTFLSSNAGENVSQDLTAGRLAVSARFSTPEDPDAYAEIDVALDGITSASSGPMSAIAAFSGMTELLQSDATAESTFAYDSATYKIVGAGDGEEVDVVANLGQGSVAAKISSGGLTYSVRGSDLDLVAESLGDGPSGFGFTADTIGWAIDLPLDENAGAQELGVLVNLEGAEVSDAVWAQMDPFGAFPRAPLSVNMDLRMAGDALIDAMNQGLSSGEVTDMPEGSAEIDIRQFNIVFGDLSLSATGALASEEVGMSAQGGLPTGNLDLTLIGANAFLDQLEQGGPFPPAQIGAVRGMLGFFGRPGAGPDTLVLAIEFTESGITANGIPLPFSP
ncbi:MAG: DUF2125 domain-containing protein [Rhodobacteraceae bacterium]|nr:DUF2125 domain-containing protein [Paracoccaceae bacterium]